MSTSITLLRHEPGALEHLIIGVADANMPSEYLWVARAFGEGPWTAFLGEDQADRIIFGRRDGGRDNFAARQIRPPRADVPEPQWREKLAQAMKVGRRRREPANGASASSFMLLRRSSLIVFGFTEDGPPETAHYYLGRDASAHELLEDLPELARLFPGRFEVL